MNLNKLKDRAYSIAKAHGWHDEEHNDEHWLMLIITELSEAVNADRKRKYANIGMFKSNCNTPQTNPEKHWKYIYDFFIKDSVQDELADVVIRCLDLAGLRQFDLSMVREIMDIIEELKPNVLFFGSMLQHLRYSNSRIGHGGNKDMCRVGGRDKILRGERHRP